MNNIKFLMEGLTSILESKNVHEKAIKEFEDAIVELHKLYDEMKDRVEQFTPYPQLKLSSTEQDFIDRVPFSRFYPNCKSTIDAINSQHRENNMIHSKSIDRIKELLRNIDNEDHEEQTKENNLELPLNDAKTNKQFDAAVKVFKSKLKDIGISRALLADDSAISKLKNEIKAHALDRATDEYDVSQKLITQIKQQYNIQ
jgi:uncharacterized coiled-coil protein SlyX